GLETILKINKQENYLLLQRSLYGLKLSGRLWYRLIRTTLNSLGFKSGPYERCIFSHEELKVFILIYVDDCLFAGPDNEVSEVISKLNKIFPSTNSNLDDFIAIKIQQSKQRKVVTCDFL